MIKEEICFPIFRLNNNIIKQIKVHGYQNWVVIKYNTMLIYIYRLKCRNYQVDHFFHYYSNMARVEFKLISHIVLVRRKNKYYK